MDDSGNDGPLAPTSETGLKLEVLANRIRQAREMAFLYGGMAAGALIISALLVPGGPPGIDLCLMHRITGLPCPGCGLTRAFCSISHGHWSAAWHFNPFGFLFYAWAVLAIPWSLWQWRHPDRRLFSEIHLIWFWRGVVVLGVVMVAHDLWRIAHGWR